MKPDVALPSSAPDGPPSSASQLPALLAIVAAIVGWLIGSEWRDAVPPAQQQLQTAAKLAGRSSPEQLDDVRRTAAQLASARATLERRLSSGESEQLVKAKLVQTLRSRCAESLATQCIVKLADGAPQAPSATAVQVRSPMALLGRDGGVASLEDLGIRRARALVSGGFTGDEPLSLVRALQNDSQQVWRLNGVVIRGNTFEVDVELHTRSTAPTGAR